MDRQNLFSDESFELALTVLSIASASVIVGLFLDNYISPYLIWGGSDCSVHSNGIRSCVGYPPTGIFVIILVVALVYFYGVTFLKRFNLGDSDA